MGYLEDIKTRRLVNEFEVKPPLCNTTLKLEITNICNHSCIVCPHSKYIRKPRMMDDDLVRRLIREAKEEGINKVAFFLNGEPFLNDKVVDYVAYSKKHNIPYVFITTNATGFPVKRILDAMDAGLDSLKISINGGSRETYAKVHNRDCYDEAINNLKEIRDYRDRNQLKCRIITGFIITKYTEAEVQEHYHMIKEYVDDIVFSSPDNFAGYMLENDVHSKIIVPKGMPYFDFSGSKITPCELLFNSVNVTCEGFLAACCSEAGNNLLVEDLRSQSLKEAWNSDRMVELRRRHLAGDISGTQCEQCVKNCFIDKIMPMNSELASVVEFMNT